MDYSVTLALECALDTLLPALDIVEQRVDDAQVPAWCARRGWTEFLLGLGDRDLARCEAEGLALVADSLSGIPHSLAELAARVRESSTLPALDVTPVTHGQRDLRGVSRRKQEQLSVLLGALTQLVVRAHRIVDVGAGSGHFTRLSAQHFEREALGLERSPERVLRANARAAETRGNFSPQFSTVDAFRDGLELCAHDLAIGLHACGELGCALVRAVRDSGADCALVSCCLQKISSPKRSALSRAARGFALPKNALGLSNLTSQAIGIEASIEHTMQAREARYALRHLLRARGLELAPGAEMHGINRRQAHAGLAEIATRALALRALAPLSDAELHQAERDAALHFRAIRRLSLPRNLLARVIELSVVLDRAAYLVEQGYAVRVATLFERAISPRNISLFASRDANRLPGVRPAVG